MNSPQLNPTGDRPDNRARVNGSAQLQSMVKSHQNIKSPNSSLNTTPVSSMSPVVSSNIPSKCIREFNELITCTLCKGYLIDATTIIECLHSFCRSCIVKYLDQGNHDSMTCPSCKVQIHKTKPKLNIRSDPTLQDIVYKIVPKLYTNEMSQRKEFYSKHPDKAVGLSNEEKGEIHGERLILSIDEQIHLSIEYFPEKSNPYQLLPFKKDDSELLDANTSSNQRRYLLCAAGMKVIHLKKFIRYKYGLEPNVEIDFFYKHEYLKDDYTIMDLAYIYSWRRNIPLPLYYAIIEPGKQSEDYVWLCSNRDLPNTQKRITKKRRLKEVIKSPNEKVNTKALVSRKHRIFNNNNVSLAPLPSCSHHQNNKHLANLENNGKKEFELKRKLAVPSTSLEIKKPKKEETTNLQKQIETKSCNNTSQGPVEDDSSTDVSEKSFHIVIDSNDDDASKSPNNNETTCAQLKTRVNVQEATSDEKPLICDKISTDKINDESTSEVKENNSLPVKISDNSSSIVEADKQSVVNGQMEKKETPTPTSIANTALTQVHASHSNRPTSNNSNFTELNDLNTKSENNENSFEPALTNHLPIKSNKPTETQISNAQPLNSITDSNAEPIIVNNKLTTRPLEDVLTISKTNTDNNDSPKSPPKVEMHKSLSALEYSILEMANLAKENEFKTLSTLNSNSQTTPLDVELGSSMNPVKILD